MIRTNSVVAVPSPPPTLRCSQYAPPAEVPATLIMSPSQSDPVCPDAASGDSRTTAHANTVTHTQFFICASVSCLRPPNAADTGTGRHCPPAPPHLSTAVSPWTTSGASAIIRWPAHESLHDERFTVHARLQGSTLLVGGDAAP